MRANAAVDIRLEPPNHLRLSLATSTAGVPDGLVVFKVAVVVLGGVARDLRVACPEHSAGAFVFRGSRRSSSSSASRS